MGSRMMPLECVHGVTVNMGDFGPHLSDDDPLCGGPDACRGCYPLCDVCEEEATTRYQEHLDLLYDSGGHDSATVRRLIDVARDVGRRRGEYLIRVGYRHLDSQARIKALEELVASKQAQIDALTTVVTS